MDSARDVATRKIIDAEQLELLHPFVNINGYICRGCDAIVTPCSYQPHNKKRAYFSAKQGHKSDCDVDGDMELVRRARKERITNPDGFSGVFPRKLVLRDERPVTADATGEAGSSKNGYKAVQYSENHAEKKNHFRTVSTIRSICRTFIDFPFNRDLPLTVPGISGNTYGSIFWQLRSGNIFFHFKPKIFYAPLYWKKPFERDEYLEILLSVGEWGEKEGKNQLIRQYKVHINWKTWSQAKRNFVTKDVEAGRLEAMLASKQEKNKVKGWLFFVGEQDSIDPTLFYVNDHRLICCWVDDMLDSYK